MRRIEIFLAAILSISTSERAEFSDDDSIKLESWFSSGDRKEIVVSLMVPIELGTQSLTAKFERVLNPIKKHAQTITPRSAGLFPKIGINRSRTEYRVKIHTIADPEIIDSTADEITFGADAVGLYRLSFMDGETTISKLEIGLSSGGIANGLYVIGNSDSKEVISLSFMEEIDGQLSFFACCLIRSNEKASKLNSPESLIVEFRSEDSDETIDAKILRPLKSVPFVNGVARDIRHLYEIGIPVNLEPKQEIVDNSDEDPFGGDSPQMRKMQILESGRYSVRFRLKSQSRDEAISQTLFGVDKEATKHPRILVFHSLSR